MVNVAETNAINCWNNEDEVEVDSQPLETTEGQAEQGTAGMFEYICRVNHSCTPNSAWSWDNEAQSMRRFRFQVLQSC